MTRSIAYHILVPITATLIGIALYHYFVTLPVMEVLDDMSERSVQVTVVSEKPTPIDSTATPSKEDSETVTIETVGGSPVSFMLPHRIYDGGEWRDIPLTAHIIGVRKYTLNPPAAYGTASIDVCGDSVCPMGKEDLSLNRTQAIIALDIKLENKQRVGSVAVDPASQMRFTQEDNFFVPKVARGEEYVEVRELSTQMVTLYTYVPAGEMRFNFIFGSNLDEPRGLFQIDFEAGELTPLLG